MGNPLPEESIMDKQAVMIFTDGACRGNPGPGGWGVLMRYKDQEKTLYGYEEHTTNNRMELLAAIMALQALKKPCHVVMTVDSEYVRKGITEWLPKWRQRNWQTANKKPIKNIDLWQRLADAAAKHHIEWCWVKGHSGHRENDLADQLANQGIDEMLNLSKVTRS